MKEIKAYIKKHRLESVIRALSKIKGLSGMSIIDSSGYGIDWHSSNIANEIDCRPGKKLEIYCRDDLADEVIAAIEKAAHTGLVGDGKIYVGNIEQAVRISTGERGEGAV